MTSRKIASAEIKYPIPVVSVSTKDRDVDLISRKSLISISSFIIAILYWQDERDVLKNTDKHIPILIHLILDEIEEVDSQKQIEGFPGYKFNSEKGEVMDVGWLLAILTRLLHDNGDELDRYKIMASGNGQSRGSDSLEKMVEVVSNISESSLEKDLEYIWILWVSYLIHMEYPVDPNKVLGEYTMPKNNGNYIRELLHDNKLFKEAFGRSMDEDEMEAYFTHYRKATTIIRDFIKEFVDPSIEDTGLRPEHYRPYEIFIFNFMYFAAIDISPNKALSMLREQLFADYADEVEAAGGRKEKILIAKR